MIRYLLLLLLFTSCASTAPTIVSTDLDNFWQAYEAVQQEADTAKQLRLFKQLFTDRASEGQMAMMAARNYTDSQYVAAIEAFPQFWESLRVSAADTARYNKRIAKDFTRFAKLYPGYQPATVYYTVGAFRSPGTGFDGRVLIGSEFALGTRSTVTSEFTPQMDYLKKYYRMQPTKYIGFLTVHEYVHTQQKPLVQNLLSQVLYEGIAEFVADKASAQSPPWEAFDYGKKNDSFVRDRFEAEMFNWRRGGNWLWNSPDNDFGVSDLGYYVGYRIAENYYKQAADKSAAIAALIGLDYSDEAAVEAIITQSNYFSAPLDTLYQRFEAARPKVVAVAEVQNGAENVSPELKSLTFRFSEPLDPRFRSTDLGELGRDHFPKIHTIEVSPDGTNAHYKVELQPNTHYQMVLGNSYRSAAGARPLQPYMFEFTTAAQ